MKKLLILLWFLIPALCLGQGINVTHMVMKPGAGGAAVGDSYPAALDTAYFWIEATDNSDLTLDGADVDSWADKSSNKWDLTAVVDKEPQWLDGVGVQFDVNDEMAKTSVSLAQPFTIFMLLRIDAVGAGQDFWDMNDGGDGKMEQYASSDRMSIDFGDAAAATEADDQEEDAWHVVRMYINGASSYIQVDEHTQRTADVGDLDIDIITLGNENADACADYTLRCMIIMNGEVTTAMTAIYNYVDGLKP